MLDYENQANPFDDRRGAISEWRENCVTDVSESAAVLETARKLVDSFRIKPKDALHVACAVAADCSHFLTTDDEILTKLGEYDHIRVTDPVEFARMEMTQ